MQNHVACLQSRAKQLLREQDQAQQRLDVCEGLLCVRDIWADVIRRALQPNKYIEEVLEKGQQAIDQQLQSLLGERSSHDMEQLLSKLPLLPFLACVDR